MKKAITLSFLLLAGTMMLIHVLILHHHHDKSAVCLLTAHCAYSEEAHKHLHSFDCHQRNDDSNMEDCPLEDVYRRPNNHKLVVDLSINNDLKHPARLSADLIAETTSMEGSAFRLEPYQQPCHTDYTSDSFGLRAPPVFV
jgi:hypothetical protein